MLEEQGGPEKLTIQRIAVPTPGPTDVLIKVQYCGVDGHDAAIRSGIRRLGFTPGMIPGHEMSGTVVAVGDQVSTLGPGDSVCNKTQPSDRDLDHLIERRLRMQQDTTLMWSLWPLPDGPRVGVFEPKLHKR